MRRLALDGGGSVPCQDAVADFLNGAWRWRAAGRSRTWCWTCPPRLFAGALHAGILNMTGTDRPRVWRLSRRDYTRRKRARRIILRRCPRTAAVYGPRAKARLRTFGRPCAMGRRGAGAERVALCGAAPDGEPVASLRIGRDIAIDADLAAGCAGTRRNAAHPSSEQ